MSSNGFPIYPFTEDVLHQNKGNPRRRKTPVPESGRQPKRAARGFLRMAVKGVPV